MLALLSSVVAPEVAGVEDLAHHWRQVLHYYSARPVAELKREPVEATRLVFHLQKMLKLVVEEQGPPPSPSRGAAPPAPALAPCLEFLLHNNVLDVLVTLCQADSPPGIRPFIFNVFIFLLEVVRYPLLPEAAVHQPLRRLVLVCALGKASPTETHELRFLGVLCAKIRRTPDLLHIFLDSCAAEAVTPCTFDTSREGSGRTSRAGDLHMATIERLAINVTAALSALQCRHALAAALANYLDSADYLVGLQAMEALLVVAALDSDVAAQVLVQGSPLLPALLGRLEALHAALPPDLDPSRLEEVRVGWAEVHHLHPDLEDPTFLGRAEALALLAFVDYLDSLARVAHTFVATSLAMELRTSFLEVHLQTRLESPDEPTVLLGLALTAQVWLHLQSDQLALTFSEWLLGALPPRGPTHPLLSSLLRLAALPGLQGMEAVRLFDVLLSTPCPYLLDRLATSHLESRGYHATSLGESQGALESPSCWSDIEEEREKMEVARGGVERGSVERSLAPSHTLAPSNIHRLVNAWLFLVPDALRLDEVRGSGYDQYVTDARRQVEAAARACQGFDWPREAASLGERSETESSDSRAEADSAWGEGAFLGLLLDQLAACLTTSYDANLGLTSVLARLAHLPHPHLHEFLLNPTVPLVAGARTLHTVLRAVAAEAVVAAEQVAHFPRKMVAVRRRLLGDGQATGEPPDPAELLLLEAVLVIDEFCKELAAITFVKYHHFSS